jgi:hypothetical protein
MKKLFVCAMLFVGGAAFAHNCVNEMKAIDAKISTEPKLPAADIDKIQALRVEGEKLHKLGRHDDSLKALREAKRMLGI